MQEFERSPEILALKKILREFFLDIIENIKGAFLGFAEWATTIRLNLPPMLKFFGNTKISGVILAAFVAYIVFVNVKAYLLFRADKRYAVAGEERVPEWRLLANIWFGGAIGSMIAMYTHHHKTKHRIFTISAIICVGLELILASVVCGFLGFWAFL